MMRARTGQEGGAVRLDRDNAWVWQGERRLELTPKAFAVLCALVEHGGRLVTKEDLMQSVWGETVVTDGALVACVREIRKALHDPAGAPLYIETVHRRGYRFIGPVVPAAPAVSRQYAAASQPEEETPKTEGPKPKAPVAPPDFAHRTPQTAIVGRDGELARLHTLLGVALNGERQMVFVTGEPGIGKTTVVEAFLAQVAAHEQVWVGRGQCVEQYGAGEAYLPVLEALGRLGRAPGGERMVELLKRYAPMWLLQLPALLNDADVDAVHRRAHGASRERMLRELPEALEALTVEAPLVLVLEDLHWSDQATIDLLSMIARRREPARLLVLGTYRPADVALSDHALKAVKEELRLRGACTEMPLEFLAEGAVGEYLTRRFARHRLPAPFRRLLHQATDGNPLFVVNMVDYLTAQGVLAEEAGGWMLRTSAEEAVRETPESLRHLIERQAARLNDKQQRLLEAASVVGVEFSAVLVAAALAESVEQVEVECEILARRGQFVRALGSATFPEGTITGRYGFVHALCQSVFYARVAAVEQIRWHRRIGEQEERLWGTQARERAAELAVHFERGQDAQRAIAYLHQAAKNALRRYAYQDAIPPATRALELLRAVPDSPARAQRELALHMLLGMAFLVTKGPAGPEVGVLYARARELCRQLGETALVFPILVGLCIFHTFSGELRRALATADELLRLAQDTQERDVLVEAHTYEGYIRYHLGEYAAATLHCEAALALYDEQQHRLHAWRYGIDPRAMAQSIRAGALLHLGYPQRALEASQEAVTSVRDLGHAYSSSVALWGAVIVHAYGRDWRAVRAFATELSILGSTHSFSLCTTLGTFGQGWALAGEGHFADGIEQMRQGLSAYLDSKIRTVRVLLPFWLAEMCGKAGRSEEARHLLAVAFDFAQETQENAWNAELYRLKGTLTLQSQTSPRQVTGKSKTRRDKSKATNPNP
jgi:DNA-binding winged helix-turn-helix (wHTH) protein/tetratricopeptide (TPR) repeat protein